jgi:hypothetical protein
LAAIGSLHLRNEHASLQYRINGVLLLDADPPAARDQRESILRHVEKEGYPSPAYEMNNFNRIDRLWLPEQDSNLRPFD